MDSEASSALPLRMEGVGRRDSRRIGWVFRACEYAEVDQKTLVSIPVVHVSPTSIVGSGGTLVTCLRLVIYVDRDLTSLVA